MATDNSVTVPAAATPEKSEDKAPVPATRKELKERLEADLAKLLAESDKAQNQINLVEAASGDIFVSGWRPFIGWVCGIAVAWTFIVQPVFIYVACRFHGVVLDLPPINTDGLYQLVLAMLGISGLRTFEKINGVARETSVFGKVAGPKK